MLCVRAYLSSRHVAMQVFSARQRLTLVFARKCGVPEWERVVSLRYFLHAEIFQNQKSTSYEMLCVRAYLSSRTVAMQVLSARQSLTLVFARKCGVLEWERVVLLRYILHAEIFQNQKSTSYEMLCVRAYLSSRTVASQVFSARQSLTSVFGMGTGGPSALITRTKISDTRSIRYSLPQLDSNQ